MVSCFKTLILHALVDISPTELLIHLCQNDLTTIKILLIIYVNSIDINHVLHVEVAVFKKHTLSQGLTMDSATLSGWRWTKRSLEEIFPLLGRGKYCTSPNTEIFRLFVIFHIPETRPLNKLLHGEGSNSCP